MLGSDTLPQLFLKVYVTPPPKRHRDAIKGVNLGLGNHLRCILECNTCVAVFVYARWKKPLGQQWPLMGVTHSVSGEH